MLVGEKLPAEVPQAASAPSAPLDTPSASTESQRAQLSSPSESTIVVPSASVNADSAIVERPYPRKLFYQLNIPILVIDLLIIGFGCYIEVASTRLWENFGPSGFSYLLAAACVSFLYTTVLAGITFWGPHIPIPALVRVLVNSLIVIPLWIGALVLFLFFRASGLPHELCRFLYIQYESDKVACWATIKNIQTLTWIGFGFGTIATIVAVIDFGYAVSLDREKRVKKRRLTSNHEPPYPNRLLYSLHISISVILVAGITASSWPLSDRAQRSFWEVRLASTIMLSALSLGLIWSCILIGLQADRIHVPALARILVNSLCIIPYLWIGAGLQIATLVTFVRQGCTFPDYDSEDFRNQCDHLLLRVAIPNGLSSALALLASILYLVDLAYSIRLHGKVLQKRHMTAPQSTP